MIHPAESVIKPLNNWGLVLIGECLLLRNISYNIGDLIGEEKERGIKMPAVYILELSR